MAGQAAISKHQQLPRAADLTLKRETVPISGRRRLHPFCDLGDGGAAAACGSLYWWRCQKYRTAEGRTIGREMANPDPPKPKNVENHRPTDPDRLILGVR